MAEEHSCISKKLPEMEIIKVRDPSNFWGIRKDHVEHSKFNELKEEIHNYFSDELIFKQVLSNPTAGTRCVVRTGTSTWERSKIEAVMATHNGYKVNCFLVDKISTELFPSSRVYVSPDWVWKVPARGVKLCLHGIQPVTIHPNYFKDTVERKCTNGRWDVSATEYFRKLIKENNGHVVVRLVELLPNDINMIRLYVHNNLENDTYNVNEILVQRKYACKGFRDPIKKLLKSDSSSSGRESTGETKEEKVQENSSYATLSEESDLQKQSSEMLKRHKEFYDEILKCAEMDALDDGVATESHDSSNTSEDCSSSQSASSFTDPRTSASESRPIKSSSHNHLNGSLLKKVAKDVCDNSTENSSSPPGSVEKHDSPERLVCSPPSHVRQRYNSPTVVDPVSDSSGKVVRSLPTNVTKPERGKNVISNVEEVTLPELISRQDKVKVAENSSGVFRHSSKQMSSDSPKDLQQATAVSSNDDSFDDNDITSDLVKQLSCDNLETEINAKLQIILSTSGDGDAHKQPRGMSLARKRVLLLEKLLEEVKRKENDCDYRFPEGIGRGMTICSDRKRTIPSHATAVNTQSNEGTSGSPVTPFKSPMKKTKKPDVDLSDKGFFLAKCGVLHSSQNCGAMLVKGVDAPNPIPLFCDAPFPQYVVEAMQRKKYRGPYFLQAHVWSAILNKRNVLALGPSNGGKTLAYVAPVIAMLDPKTRSSNVKAVTCKPSLPSRSPPVVVLCPSWVSVEKVVRYFQLFLKPPCRDGSRQTIRVVGISGGPKNEEANVVDLLSGCHVLVCSPFTLLRVLRAKYIDLKRLEQLIFDDFHVLVEEFTEQVREVMQLWTETLEDPDRMPASAVKPQILCFGIQWTTGVENFMKIFMKKPLLYISDPLEASVYGEVVHHVDVLTRHSMFECLRRLVKNSTPKEGGVAVFVSDIEKMKDVCSSLKSMSMFCVEAHQGMPDFELQSIQQSLDDPSSSPVLVVCDDVLSVIEVDNIEIAIHYDFPKDQYTLGMRLSMMRHYFKIEKANIQPSIVPHSHLLLDEKELPTSLWLEKLLSRLAQPSTVHYIKVAKIAMENKEITKGLYSLCPFVRSYGHCRDEKTCGFRHWVSKTLDQPNIDRYALVPTCGHVKVRITNVKHATMFHGHLVKHKPAPSQPTCVYPQFYEQLRHELNEYYSDENNWKKPDAAYKVKLEEVFAIKIDDQYFRAKIVESSPMCTKPKQIKWKTQGGVIKVRVVLVDVGSVHKINYDELLFLASKFSSTVTPYQAIVVRMAYAKPIDNDNEWLFAANKVVHDLVFDKEIEGNIILSINHEIWLSPVVIRSKLPITGRYVDDCKVLNELLNSGLAEKDPHQLDKILGDLKGSDGISVNQVKSASTFSSIEHKINSSTSAKRLQDLDAVSKTLENSTIALDKKVESSTSNQPQDSSAKKGKVSIKSSSKDAKDRSPFLIKNNPNDKTDSLTERMKSSFVKLSENIKDSTVNAKEVMKSKPTRAESGAATSVSSANVRKTSPTSTKKIECVQKEIVKNKASTPLTCKSIPSSIEESRQATDLPSLISKRIISPKRLNPSPSRVMSGQYKTPTASTPTNKKDFTDQKLNFSSDSDITLYDEAIECVGPIIGRTPPLSDSSCIYDDLPPLIVAPSSNVRRCENRNNSSKSSPSGSFTLSSLSDLSTNSAELKKTRNGTSQQSPSKPATRISPPKLCYSTGYLSTSDESSRLKPKPVIARYSNGSFLSTDESEKETKSHTPHNKNKMKEHSINTSPSTPLASLPCSEATDVKPEEVSPLHPANVNKVMEDTAFKKVSNYLKNQKHVECDTVPDISFKINNNDELPPHKDISNTSLLYPCYVKLCYCQDAKERRKICQEVYASCSEAYDSVTQRDLQSVFKALMSSKTPREATLLAGSLLALAVNKLPVIDYVSLPVLIKRFCLGYSGQHAQLPHTVLALCLVLVPEMIESHAKDLPQLSELLVGFLNRIIMGSSMPQDDVTSLVKTVLKLIRRILFSPNQPFSKAKQMHLIEILSRVKSHPETDDLRQALFARLTDCAKEEENGDEEPPRPAIREASKIKAPLPKKQYDRLDYDRFNGIDTTDTSDGASSYRPYTPVYHKFDSETETQYSESETDTDFLPGT